MASDSVCTTCRRPKASLECELCFEPLCAGCDQYLDAGTFSFLEAVPEELQNTHYCMACHDATVAPVLEKYHETMERAKGIFFFFRTQRKAPPILKRAREGVKVDECLDRDETILRLGFKAAELGWNSIIEGEVIAKKVRNGAYQKSMWSGSGIPARVDTEKLERYENQDIR